MSTKLPGRDAGTARPPRYDELHGADGRVRAAWKPLIDTLQTLGPAEFSRRQDAAQAMLLDNGVTYNVYDQKQGQSRRWRLDILPFVLGADDWALIERGVIQRARLADALLADIYGPQRLIAEGVLPPHVVYGHPQFLRPLVGVEPPGGVHTHLYSVDLARMPDGSWTVLSSRADAASGIGYALENRIVVGQMFSDLFDEMKVRRLAVFFNAYREAVQSLAAGKAGRTVLLTSGPHNEAYFEHAFLAHYLDLTLVEGDDLVVHDARVYLKTLHGLEPVAVIFRRVDSHYCDPLELKADSALGVPGLLQAVRAGHVVLANALGGSVVESPALDAYLHGAARALLDEDLLIPDIPTVWCGTGWGRAEALQRLDRAIVRGAFDSRPLFSRRSTARLGSEMTPAERGALQAFLERRGVAFVTQDIVPFGSAPIYDGGTMAARPVSLRVFAAWTKDGYRVMPSALARVADNETIQALSLQSGALSKDVWVPSAGPVSTFSLLRPSGDPVPVQRTGDSPPSRAMDNLYWLGRYSERADNLARVLRTLLRRLGEGGEDGGGTSRQHFLLDYACDFVPDRMLRGADGRLAAVIKALMCDRQLPGSLPQLLSQVSQAAWSARDRLALDSWRTIQVMSDAIYVTAPDKPFDIAEALSSLDKLVRRGAAFAGYCTENMTRGPNWLFTDLGRRIERALHLVWLIGRTVRGDAASESERIRIALEIASSTMTYRSRYFNALHIVPTVDLLLLDGGNPRSVAFQLLAVKTALAELARITGEGQGSIAFMLASSLCDAATAIALPGDAPEAVVSAAQLQKLEIGIAGISDAVTDAYFRHVQRRRTGGAPWEA